MRNRPKSIGICEMIGRPETHPIKKVIGFSEDMIDAVDRWRAKQKPVPNQSEAIRRLVELGLKAKPKDKSARFQMG